MFTRSAVLASALAFSSLVAAAPAGNLSTEGSNTWSSWTTSSTTTVSKPTDQPSSTVHGAPLKSGNPFSFPLSDGFPDLDSAALAATFIRAHGTEPNGEAPTLAVDDLTSVQLIAFNELFEVAFFTDLLFNVTNYIPGYTFADHATTKRVIDALTAIQAQEELHADNANKILKANKIEPIQACRYKFPVSDFKGAIRLAQTFTDVVLGTLQDVQLKLAKNGDAGVVPIIGSVIGQEGQQDGWFRTEQGKIPSAQPFLTRSTREFAFSALNQAFVVPGSCPNSHTINLPVFRPLTVNTDPVEAKDQYLSFSMPIVENVTPASLSLVLINGQNKPLTQQIENAQVSNGMVTFTARFPFTENVLNGLTIAAVTKSAGPFTDAEGVAQMTVAGPGLIEIL